MDQRISFVTLAVADLDRTRAFYLDGLGWTAAIDVPGEVLMIQAGEHLCSRCGARRSSRPRSARSPGAPGWRR